MGVAITLATINVKEPVTSVNYTNEGVLAYKYGFPLHYGQETAPAYQVGDISDETTPRFHLMAAASNLLFWSSFSAILAFSFYNIYFTRGKPQ